MGRVWKNFEVYYRKSLYCIEAIVDRNMNVKGDFSVNTSCYGVTLEKRVDLLKKPSKNMEEIDVHT